MYLHTGAIASVRELPNTVLTLPTGGHPFRSGVPFPRELPVPPLHMGPGGDSVPLSHPPQTPPTMGMYGQAPIHPGQTSEVQQQMKPGRWLLGNVAGSRQCSCPWCVDVDGGLTWWVVWWV